MVAGSRDRFSSRRDYIRKVHVHYLSLSFPSSLALSSARFSSLPALARETRDARDLDEYPITLYATRESLAAALKREREREEFHSSVVTK